MAIKGSLKEASLPDVLQLLALGKKTGCLSVTDRTNLGNIYFDNGWICHASIVNRRDRLGDMLVKRPTMTTRADDGSCPALPCMGLLTEFPHYRAFHSPMRWSHIVE